MAQLSQLRAKAGLDCQGCSGARDPHASSAAAHRMHAVWDWVRQSLRTGSGENATRLRPGRRLSSPPFGQRRSE